MIVLASDTGITLVPWSSLTVLVVQLAVSSVGGRS